MQIFRALEVLLEEAWMEQIWIAQALLTPFKILLLQGQRALPNNSSVNHKISLLYVPMFRENIKRLNIFEAYDSHDQHAIAVGVEAIIFGNGFLIDFNNFFLTAITQKGCNQEQ